MVDLLFKLMDTLGPSGDEELVRNIIRSEIKKYVDEVRIEKFGNLVAHKKGRGQKIMLASHMDEIGLMAKKIEDNGFIRVSIIGGIEPITIVGQQVSIVSDNNKAICNGVISCPELHEDHPIKEIPKVDELYVDTGLNKKALNKIGVEIGNYIVPSHHARYIGDGSIISGKALDDRAGCYILIELAKKLSKSRSNVDIYYVFTVQEEMGLYGAKTAAYNIAPDWGIAIDVTNPKDSSIIGKQVIGNGPYITIKDAQMLGNRALDNWLKKIAKLNKIPLQLEVEDSGSTDAASIMLAKGGIPSTTISVPVRNIHSTVGIANVNDIITTIRLLSILLKKPPKI